MLHFCSEGERDAFFYQKSRDGTDGPRHGRLERAVVAKAEESVQLFDVSWHRQSSENVDLGA